MSVFRARIDHGLTGTMPACELSGFDAKLIGHEAHLSLRLKVDVTRSSGVDLTNPLFEAPLKLGGPVVRVPVSELPETLYAYRGEQIDMTIVARLRVDDGVIFDTTLETPLDVPMRTLAKDAAKTANWIEPPDRYSLAANLRALSPADRWVVKLLLAVAGLIGGGNAVVGLHDEFVPESLVLWYDHRGSDGSESPAMKSLTGSGVLGFGLWMAIRARLRRYMRIALAPDVATPRRGERRAARDLILGESRVPLERSTLRVVAANRENGQYTEKSGKETKTRNFQTPVQSVVLFEQFLPHVPAGNALSDHIDGDVDFEPIFTELLPPLLIGNTHGIDVVWEVQLLHPDFVDQEIIGPAEWTCSDWHAEAATNERSAPA